MYSTFVGKISGGKLVIEELGTRLKILEGKHIAIIPLEVNKENHVVGGTVLPGVFKEGSLILENKEKAPLAKLENKAVWVVIRHEIMGRLTPEVFEQKFQLGAKDTIDLDN